MKQDRIKNWVYGVLFLSGVLAPAWSQPEAQSEEEKMTVATGQEVSLEYTLRLEDKKVIDTNVGKDPLTYTHGTQQIVPGLEKALEGMAIGETKQVTVAPEEAYGITNPKAFQEVSKDKIPPDAQKVGMELQGKDAKGRIVRPRVVEIKEDTVVLDFNHPLAGNTLYFDVKVLDIKAGNAPKP